MPSVTIPGTRFLVGGAVRDELLGIPIKERDWVVTGTTAEAMLEAGFLQVGKAYPVFLHPETHEEYALARTETKVGPGHGGFTFATGIRVTLEEDLGRRDLTINALAKSETHEIIDPFGGQADLRAKILRHVSKAFNEDPLRCYRVARFAATLPDFTVHETTVALMRSMAEQLSELSAERVWNEWVKALQGVAPYRFYEVCQAAELGAAWFKELDLNALADQHRERKVTLQGAFAVVGWLHSERAIETLFARLKAPNKALVMSLNVHRYGRAFLNVLQLSDTALLDLLENTGAMHGDTRFATFLEALACVIDIDTSSLYQLREVLRNVTIDGQPGPDYGRSLRKKRLERLRELRS